MYLSALDQDVQIRRLCTNCQNFSWWVHKIVGPLKRESTDYDYHYRRTRPEIPRCRVVIPQARACAQRARPRRLVTTALVTSWCRSPGTSSSLVSVKVRPFRPNASEVSSAAGTHPCLSAIVVLCTVPHSLNPLQGFRLVFLRVSGHAVTRQPQRPRPRVDIAPTHHSTAC